MADLRIKVGASVDRGLADAYQPLIAAANKAAASIAVAGKRGGASVAAGTKSGTSAAEKEFAKLERTTVRWQREAAKAADKAAAAQVSAAERAARATEREAAKAATAEIREAEKVTRAQERELAKRERAQRAAAKAADKSAIVATRETGQAVRSASRYLGRSASGAASTVFGVGGRIAHAGLGVARDLARGAGIDADLGSMFSKNADLETSATKISNAGFMAGDARNGQRVDSRALTDQALKVGASTGTDANVALEGLDKFVAKTGDLQSGRDILEQMAKLSKATGSSLEDMMNGAGDVANQLGDVANKGELINQVMRAVSAQGKMGAVEIRDLAKQMAKVAAASTMFTGNRADVMTQMGALAQMTRAKGGAASASQAATSLGAFTDTFSKGARLDKFAAHGVKVTGEDGKTRAPIEIIKDALRATKGDNRSMNEMFASTAARRVTRGFETTYKDAGGGEAGIVAVQKAFDELKNATIADEEVAQSFAAAMRTSQSQAEVFNQEMRKSAMVMQEQLMPAMMQLAPAVVAATKSLANVVTWLTGDKQLRGATDMVNRDVPGAISSTDKQIAGGVISAPQREMNRIAENEAREAFSRASAEYQQKKEENDAKVDELRKGDSTGHAVFRREAKVQDIEKGAAEVASSKATMDAAQKSFQAMLGENAKVAELLRTHTIRVVVTNPTGKPALSSPKDGVEGPPGSGDVQ
jgi:hypothetical protein